MGRRNPKRGDSVAFEGETRRAHAAENPEHENNDDTQKSDDQGIGEPSLAPSGERQAGARRKPFRFH